MHPAKVLNYYLKTYDATNKTLVSTKNRLAAIMDGADPKHQDIIKILDSLKGKLSSRIAKELEIYPLWTEWLKYIKGIGPFIGGNLLYMYYFKSIAICKKCGTDLEEFVCPACQTKSKRGGILKFRIEDRDYANISKWWKFLGLHTVDGVKPKMAKGVQCDWSPKGRMICWQFGQQVNRQTKDHPYKAFLLDRKKKRMRTHPDTTPKHRQSMAEHETAKLFTSHFWVVARTLDGKPVTEPYISAIEKHTGIIPPYYFEEIKEEMKKAA